jgi:hypothetical protein
MYDNLTLEQLKAQREVVKRRLALAKANTSKTWHEKSQTILALTRDDVRLAYLIENYIPYDITPSPGSGGGRSSPALLHA